jgi:hypothetical protein
LRIHRDGGDLVLLLNVSIVLAGEVVSSEADEDLCDDGVGLAAAIVVVGHRTTASGYAVTRGDVVLPPAAGVTIRMWKEIVIISPRTSPWQSIFLLLTMITTN